MLAKCMENDVTAVGLYGRMVEQLQLQEFKCPHGGRKGRFGMGGREETLFPRQHCPFPLRGLRQNPCLSAVPYGTIYFVWIMLCPGCADSIFSEINDRDADL